MKNSYEEKVIIPFISAVGVIQNSEVTTFVPYTNTLPDRLYHTPDSQKNVLCFLTTFQIR